MRTVNSARSLSLHTMPPTLKCKCGREFTSHTALRACQDGHRIGRRAGDAEAREVIEREGGR